MHVCVCTHICTYIYVSRKATICVTVYMLTDPRSFKVINLRKCVKADT